MCMYSWAILLQPNCIFLMPHFIYFLMPRILNVIKTRNIHVYVQLGYKESTDILGLDAYQYINFLYWPGSYCLNIYLLIVHFIHQYFNCLREFYKYTCIFKFSSHILEWFRLLSDLLINCRLPPPPPFACPYQRQSGWWGVHSTYMNSYHINKEYPARYQTHAN